MPKIFAGFCPKNFPTGRITGLKCRVLKPAGILGAVIEEAKKCKIPIHRAIATVAGSSFYGDSDLTALAHLAAKEKIEVIICPWKLARLVLDNPNRILNGLKLDDEEINEYLSEIDRCVSLGFRGFLVWDKDVLELLDYKRKKGGLPADTIFKLSTFANSVNFLNFGSAVRKGANTINTANGLSLKKLALIRYLTPREVKLDVHIVFWSIFFAPNEKGNLELTASPYDRIKDAPEIARICSPVYFKFEAGTPGIGVYNMTSFWTFEKLAEPQTP